MIVLLARYYSMSSVQSWEEMKNKSELKRYKDLDGKALYR